MFLGPDLHDAGVAEGPVAAHTERGDEAGGAEVPRFLRKVDQAGKDGVDKNARGHGADAADPVAEPAEDHTAAGRTEKKRRGGVAHPLGDEGVIQR